MEKTIKEMAVMSREELFEEAVIMRGRLLDLRKQLVWKEGHLAMAERPAETTDH